MGLLRFFGFCVGWVVVVYLVVCGLGGAAGLGWFTLGFGILL